MKSRGDLKLEVKRLHHELSNCNIVKQVLKKDVNKLNDANSDINEENLLLQQKVAVLKGLVNSDVEKLTNKVKELSEKNSKLLIKIKELVSKISKNERQGV